MAIDSQEIVGKWTVKVQGWTWEYIFMPDGSLTWRDPLNNKNGAGRWTVSPKFINLSWTGSGTVESLKRPITPYKQEGWYSSSYFTGKYEMQKQVAAPSARATASDGYYEIDIDVITSDPRTHPLYIDSLCEAVGYGIYNKGFYVYIPQSMSKHPLLVPERMMWFGSTGSERVSDTIFPSQKEAFAAIGNSALPDRVAYYWGAGVVCPTAFTDATTPTILNTARFVVDKLVTEVQEELIAIAIPILGGLVARGILARIARRRPVGKAPPARLTKPEDPVPRPQPPTPRKPYVDLNPSATSAESNLGSWLDSQAQSGRLGVVKRVRGMPEAKGAGGNPDYHLFFSDLDNGMLGKSSTPFDLRGDAVIAEGANFDNVVTSAAGSKSGRQADVIIIEVGTRGQSGQITDEAIRAWKIGDIRTTFPKLRRVIVVRNEGGVRRSVLDLEAR